MFRNIIRINKTYEYLPVREAKRLRVPDLPEWTGDSSEARNLQVGGPPTIFQLLGGHKLKNLKICLWICTYVRGFRNLWACAHPAPILASLLTGDSSI
jgi:hypothetical protein